jgi:transposase-like protein
MFLVVAMDGNNNIVPIAFGVGRSETADEWTWFLNMLKGCIGEPEGLVFVSDRAASINVAITNIFPSAHHALCCRHLLMNVRSRDQRIKIFKTPYWKACKAYTTREFDRMMHVLQVEVPAGAQLMEEVGVDRWSRAHFPGERYNIMTSNSAESINAMSRFARRLPIVGLMEYFREFQQEWYFIRRDKAG